MRVAAWVLLFVTICLGLLIGYSLYAAELRVTRPEARVVPAADMLAQFQALHRAVQERALLGRQFQQGPDDDPSAYVFHIYTVRLRNDGLIPAEWVRLDVEPGPGDVLQAEGESAGHLAALSSGDMQLLVLAQHGATTARRLTLTYFVWGRAYSIPIDVR